MHLIISSEQTLWCTFYMIDLSDLQLLFFFSSAYYWTFVVSVVHVFELNVVDIISSSSIYLVNQQIFCSLHKCLKWPEFWMKCFTCIFSSYYWFKNLPWRFTPLHINVVQTRYMFNMFLSIRFGLLYCYVHILMYFFFTSLVPQEPPAEANLWFLGIIFGVILLIIVIILICCVLYRNACKSGTYPGGFWSQFTYVSSLIN